MFEKDLEKLNQIVEDSQNGYEKTRKLLQQKKKQMQAAKKRQKDMEASIMAKDLSVHNITVRELPMVVGAIKLIRKENRIEEATTLGNKLLGVEAQSEG